MDACWAQGHLYIERKWVGERYKNTQQCVERSHKRSESRGNYWRDFVANTFKAKTGIEEKVQPIYAKEIYYVCQRKRARKRVVRGLKRNLDERRLSVHLCKTPMMSPQTSWKMLDKRIPRICVLMKIWRGVASLLICLGVRRTRI